MFNAKLYKNNCISTSFNHVWPQLCEDDTLGVPILEP
jgi:hypothetical protein